MTNEYYKNLPRKRMGSGIMLFNKNNEILIVKPSYKDHWSLPGGVIDENESPKEACVRETQEEINIKINNPIFLSVTYHPPGPKPDKDDSLQFIFYGGTLNDEQIANIKLTDGEISEYKFLKINEALSLVGNKSRTRILKSMEAIESKAAIYSED